MNDPTNFLGLSSYSNFQQDLKDLEQYGGKKQFLIKEIPVDALIDDQQLNINPCNFVMLMPRVVRSDRTIITSDVAARVFLEFNDSGAGIPFSLIPNSQDFTNISSTIRSIKYSVKIVGAAGAKLYLLVGFAVSLGSSGANGGSSGGGYSGRVLGGSGQ